MWWGYVCERVYQWQFYDGFVTRFSINLFISIRFDANEPKKKHHTCIEYSMYRTNIHSEWVNRRKEFAKLVRVKVVHLHRICEPHKMYEWVRACASTFPLGFYSISLFFLLRLRCALQRFEAYSRFCVVCVCVWVSMSIKSQRGRV